MDKNTSPARRPTTADLALTEFDLIIIGGGITGAGIAQDAATRGLRTLLLEKGDFASGTSSKSTKLIHGGLRYLQQFQFAVTQESLRERQLQMRLAPHLVWSVPFVIPTYRGFKSFFKNSKLRAGLWLYDLMAGFKGHQFHRSISAKEVRERCPGVRNKGLNGGFLYNDCRTDDARHVVEVIKSAVEHGAYALNYAKVTRFIRMSDHIVGVEVVHGVDGPSRPVCLYGKVVVNATGVWNEKVTEAGGVKRMTKIVPAKGVHITVSRDRLPITSAMIVPSVHDDRFCFAVPWYDSVVIGTTDTEYRGNLDHIVVEKSEIHYILDAVNALFPDLHLTESDVSGRFAGLRPLVRQANAGSTAEISRQHHVEVSPDGLISIAGGKLTTYRLMAASTVDLVIERIKREFPERSFGPCKTAELMLGGWSATDDVPAEIARMKEQALQLGLSTDTADYLPTVYGKRTHEVLDIVAENVVFAERISPKHPYIMAQVVFAVRSEAAHTLEDVLARRIRLTITDERAAAAAANRVAAIIAAQLSWDPTHVARELNRFRMNLR